MNQKFRILLLVGCIFTFLILAPMIVLYTQGIRIDFASKKLVRTGAIFVQGLTPNVDVYINGKYKKTTNFFSGNSVFVKNLLPKDYLVEIKKDGYLSWKKELSVTEGMVSEIKHLTLFKSNPLFEVMGNDIEGFSFSPRGRFAIISKTLDNAPAQELINAATKESKPWTDIDDIKPPAPYKIEQWNEEGKKIILTRGDGPDTRLLVVSYEFFPEIQFTTTTIKNNVIQKASIDPDDQNQIIFLSGDKLYRQTLNEQQIKTIASKELLWFTTANNEVFCLKKSGFITRLYKDGKEELLNKTPLMAESENNDFQPLGYDRDFQPLGYARDFQPFGYAQDFQLQKFQEDILLRFNGNIFFLNNNGVFEKIGEALDWSISPDGRKLIFFGNQEVWLIDKENGVKKPIFLNRFWKTPDSLFWLDDRNMIFNIGEEIKISEVNGNSLNISTLKKMPGDSILFFNQNDKKLYLLNGKTLYVSEKLLP